MCDNIQRTLPDTVVEEVKQYIFLYSLDVILDPVVVG